MATKAPKKRAKRKGTITRTKARKPPKGATVKDLVGKLVLNEDPVAYQRRLRDEW
ncbi:MAG TPA: hypothetical protein PKE21_00810 [Flavobacteriales bacterium]|nr:hypothetical protein [Flavobacteriales bacterium]HMR25992.1 hypothetical protein [Flavobacteriales bacterium]